MRNIARIFSLIVLGALPQFGFGLTITCQVVDSKAGPVEGAEVAAWGVKALPWLILTDKEHKVVAEGFAVSELDKVLEKIR